MARPKKNNAEYFSHDADMRNDVKIKALRRKFSHTGYAVWNYLLETLTDSDYFEVEWEDINIELLAADYEVTVEELQAIVEYCLKIGLLKQQGDKLYSEAHKKRFTPLLANRERKRFMYGNNPAETPENGDTASHNPAETPENGDTASHNPAETNEGGEYGKPKPHSKVKESKVKESKEEKNKEEKNIQYPYQDIVALWNSVCSSLPKIKTLNDNRLQKIRLRLAEFSDDSSRWLSFCQEIFEKIQASKFLNGGNDSGWTATFDWVFENSKNWLKIVEGNYDNNRGAKSAPVPGANNLGVGEYIDNIGKRTYGTGKANIPMSAPPRPSDSYTWNESSKTWIML